MKKAAKVFLILGIIVGFVLVIPPIIGFLTLRRLNNPRKTNDIRVWGILSAIFVSTIGGIFVILMSKNEFYDDITRCNEDLFESAVMNLRMLNNLHKEGKISEEEFLSKRAKYLEVL